MIKKYIAYSDPRRTKLFVFIIIIAIMTAFSVQSVYATGTSPPPAGNETGTGDIWSKANDLIVDIYNKIAGISTVLAGLMSAVAVIGAKMSNNQHKVDQAWDWLRRIWIAWAIINGIGAFIAYIRPLFEGFNKIDV